MTEYPLKSSSIMPEVEPVEEAKEEEAKEEKMDEELEECNAPKSTPCVS
jgi:hypothetical protein